jgi:hypothetical protein
MTAAQSISPKLPLTRTPRFCVSIALTGLAKRMARPRLSFSNSRP